MKHSKLVEETILHVKKEQQFTLLVLKNLQKIDHEKIFLDYNCQSLLVFCTDVLKYNDSEASVRVSAMRLLGQNLGVSDKIESGQLTLSSAAMIQLFFVAEEKENNQQLTFQKKLQIIEEMQGKSARATQEALNAKRSNPRPKIYNLVVDEEAYTKIERISHEMGTKDQSKILNQLCDEHDETSAIKEELLRCQQLLAKARTELSKKAPAKQPTDVEPIPVATVPESKSRFIPTEVKRAVLLRAEGQCEHRSHVNGDRCKMKNSLEFEHCKPYSIDGSNDEDNIKLLCRDYKVREAIKVFGAQKINSYLHKRT
ncbi:MAG: hypothetical protein HQK52_16415 [Oligoflexia bacterium]|nr:hypothetical protein [Oligoflexia bacterium]